MKGTPLEEVLRHDAPLQWSGSSKASPVQSAMDRIVTEVNAACATMGYVNEANEPVTSQTAFSSAAAGEYPSRPDLGVPPSEIKTDPAQEFPDNSGITFS
jgi:hypothetical protein